MLQLCHKSQGCRDRDMGRPGDSLQVPPSAVRPSVILACIIVYHRACMNQNVPKPSKALMKVMCSLCSCRFVSSLPRASSQGVFQMEPVRRSTVKQEDTGRFLSSLMLLMLEAQPLSRCFSQLQDCGPYREFIKPEDQYLLSTPQSWIALICFSQFLYVSFSHTHTHFHAFSELTLIQSKGSLAVLMFFKSNSP